MIAEYWLDSLMDELLLQRSADVQTLAVPKLNDQERTALAIRQPGETSAPLIYLEPYYEQYKNGASINMLAASIWKEYDQNREAVREMNQQSFSKYLSYSAARNRLEIHLCSPERNTEYLRQRVSCIPETAPDFAVTYHVCLDDTRTTPVTPQLLEHWGITAEELHQDALACLKNQTPALYEITELMTNMVFYSESPTDYLEPGQRIPEDGSLPLYVLCNKYISNFGASFILRESTMQLIGDRLGEDYYVLPSSVHEVLITPISAELSPDELREVVYMVNRSDSMRPEEILSDEVQVYDRSEGKLVNAKAYEMEQQEQREKEAGTGNRPENPEKRGPRM